MINKKDIILMVIALLSAIGCFLMLPYLPAQMPMHWGIDGQVDRYGSVSDFMRLSLVPVGLLILMWVLPLIDPRKDNYKRHAKAYTATKYVVVLLLISINWLTILFTMGLIKSMDTIIIIAVAITFVILGNYMPQIRHNYFFGIKTPWTLADEVVWKKTHRLGGLLFVITGLLLIPVSMVSKEWTFYILITGTVLLTLGTALYSLVLFKQREKAKMTDKPDDDAK